MTRGNSKFCDVALAIGDLMDAPEKAIAMRSFERTVSTLSELSTGSRGSSEEVCTVLHIARLIFLFYSVLRVFVLSCCRCFGCGGEKRWKPPWHTCECVQNFGRVTLNECAAFFFWLAHQPHARVSTLPCSMCDLKSSIGSMCRLVCPRRSTFLRDSSPALKIYI